MTTLKRADVRVGLWLVALMAVVALVWDGPDGSKDMALGQEGAQKMTAEEAAGKMACCSRIAPR